MKLEEIDRKVLLRQATGIVNNDELAKDCVQEALSKVWVKILQGVKIENLMGYVVTAVRNEALQTKRRDRYVDSRGIDVAFGFAHEAPKFDKAVEMKEQIEEVRKSYPEIVDGFAQEMSYAEMAAQQHISVAALKTKIFRMRNKHGKQ